MRRHSLGVESGDCLNFPVKNSTTLMLLRYKYPPLFIAEYSLLQLSELEQCGVDELAQGSTLRQQEDSNSECALDNAL